MNSMMIEYAWILTDNLGTSQLNRPWDLRPYVNATGLILHRDWYGRPCGGEFTYQHRHSFFDHKGWWMCGLCSRKVCDYQPDPLMAAAQEAIAYV